MIERDNYGAISRMHDHDYRWWCSRNQMDPESLDAILAYEEEVNPTDEGASA